MTPNNHRTAAPFVPLLLSALVLLAVGTVFVKIQSIADYRCKAVDDADSLVGTYRDEYRIYDNEWTDAHYKLILDADGTFNESKSYDNGYVQSGSGQWTVVHDGGTVQAMLSTSIHVQKRLPGLAPVELTLRRCQDRLWLTSPWDAERNALESVIGNQ